MKRSLLGFIAFVLFGGAAHGAEQCSNAILNGTYSLYANGTVIGVGPVGLVAVLKFDGRSTLTGIVFQRVNGNIAQFTVTGTYSVDSNCIYTDTTFASTGQTATHTAVVADKGNEFYSLNMTPSPANVIVGIGKKQFLGNGGDNDR
jgi:hypothetical protein